MVAPSTVALLTAGASGTDAATEEPSLSPSATVSASTSSLALWKRASGSRATPLAQKASKPGGTGATADGTGRGSTTI